MIVTNMTGSALLGPGPVFSFIEGEAMELKPFKTYQEQVEILRGRGMRIGDASFAEEKLRTRNYYRLSGYWYPFRIMSTDRSHRLDKFCEGAAFSDVLALYDFDAELRAAVYHELALIESAIRALQEGGLRQTPHERLRQRAARVGGGRSDGLGPPLLPVRICAPEIANANRGICGALRGPTRVVAEMPKCCA